MKFFRIDNNAQAFAGYKLIIAIIMALLMLVIIINAVNYVEQNKYSISTTRFYEGIGDAIQGPDGKQIIISDLVFAAGTVYTKAAIANRFNLDQGCIEFRHPDYTIFEGSNDEHVQINENYSCDVYVSCDTSCNSESPIYCIISFVLPISNE